MEASLGFVQTGRPLNYGEVAEIEIGVVMPGISRTPRSTEKSLHSLQLHEGTDSLCTPHAPLSCPAFQFRWCSFSPKAALRRLPTGGSPVLPGAPRGRGRASWIGLCSQLHSLGSARGAFVARCHRPSARMWRGILQVGAYRCL